MGLFGENMNWRGRQVRQARPSRMVIPPGWFLLFLLVLALVVMGVWL
jgi:hypothetical protein